MKEKLFTQSEVNEYLQVRVARMRRHLVSDLDRVTAENAVLRLENTQLRAELNDLWPMPRPRLAAYIDTWIRRYEKGSTP